MITHRIYSLFYTAVTLLVLAASLSIITVLDNGRLASWGDILRVLYDESVYGDLARRFFTTVSQWILVVAGALLLNLFFSALGFLYSSAKLFVFLSISTAVLVINFAWLVVHPHALLVVVIALLWQCGQDSGENRFRVYDEKNAKLSSFATSALWFFTASHRLSDSIVPRTYILLTALVLLLLDDIRLGYIGLAQFLLHAIDIGVASYIGAALCMIALAGVLVWGLSRWWKFYSDNKLNPVGVTAVVPHKRVLRKLAPGFVVLSVALLLWVGNLPWLSPADFESFPLLEKDLSFLQQLTDAFFIAGISIFTAISIFLVRGSLSHLPVAARSALLLSAVVFSVLILPGLILTLPEFAGPGGSGIFVGIIWWAILRERFEQALDVCFRYWPRPPDFRKLLILAGRFFRRLPAREWGLLLVWLLAVLWFGVYNQ